MLNVALKAHQVGQQPDVECLEQDGGFQNTKHATADAPNVSANLMTPAVAARLCGV